MQQLPPICWVPRWMVRVTLTGASQAPCHPARLPSGREFCGARRATFVNARSERRRRFRFDCRSEGEVRRRQGATARPLPPRRQCPAQVPQFRHSRASLVRGTPQAVGRCSDRRAQPSHGDLGNLASLVLRKLINDFRGNGVAPAAGASVINEFCFPEHDPPTIADRFKRNEVHSGRYPLLWINRVGW